MSLLKTQTIVIDFCLIGISQWWTIAQALIPCSTPKVITRYIPILIATQWQKCHGSVCRWCNRTKSIDNWSTTVSYTLTFTIHVSAMGTSSNFWANTRSITSRTRTIMAYCIMTSLDSGTGTGTALGSSPSVRSSHHLMLDHALMDSFFLDSRTY